MPAGAGGFGDAPPPGVGQIGLDWNWQRIYGLNLPNYIVIADLDLKLADLGISVGLGGVPIFQPGFSLPSSNAEISQIIGPGPEAIGTSDIPPQIDRRDIASTQGIVPPEEDEVSFSDLGPNVTTVLSGGGGVYPGMSNEEWLAVMFPGSTPALPISTPTAQIVANQESEVGWIEDIYTSVDSDVFGGMLPGGAPVGGMPLTGVAGPATVSNLPVAVSPVAGTPAAVVNPAVKQYCYKFKDGAWQLVKMRRRRRKQLATKGDLNDLAALKGILGLGKAFEVWIATHS